MKFQLLPLVFLIWAALPFSSAQHYYNADNSASFCGPSTFTDQTSAASPKLEDCEALMFKASQALEESLGSLPSNKTDFGRKQKTIISYKTCHFGIQQKGGDRATSLIGNWDIYIVFETAINKSHLIGSTFRIGAEGEMDCYAMDNETMIGPMQGPNLWGIY